MNPYWIHFPILQIKLKADNFIVFCVDSLFGCHFILGKRWVECRDQSQISIPDQIDMETQVLDLSGNNLQILPREVFARHGLLNLQRLHLADCRIGQIDQTAFRGLTNLVELNLAGNLLTSVPIATFSGNSFPFFDVSIKYICLFKCIKVHISRNCYIIFYLNKSLREPTLWIKNSHLLKKQRACVYHPERK